MKKVSTFLAIAFSGFLVYVFDKIWGNTIEWKQIKAFSLGNLLNKGFTIRIYQIILFSLIVAIVIFLKKKFFNGEGYNKKERQLKEFNQYNDLNNGIRLKWIVNFDYYTETPYAYEPTAFCTKHGPVPLRFIHNVCPDQTCVNHRQAISPYMVKNSIESMLIAKWDEINSK